MLIKLYLLTNAFVEYNERVEFWGDEPCRASDCVSSSSVCTFQMSLLVRRHSSIETRPPRLDEFSTRFISLQSIRLTVNQI
jgi:hypothetical protein